MLYSAKKRRQCSALHTCCQSFNNVQVIQIHRLAFLKDLAHILYLPMMPHEDEVALVVQCDDSASVELWVVGKHGGQQTTNRVAEARVEVVQNNLWLMFTHTATVLSTKHQ